MELGNPCNRSGRLYDGGRGPPDKAAKEASVPFAPQATESRTKNQYDRKILSRLVNYKE